MDLRQLRVFTEVAQRRSFTRAAEHLRIAQPAVSISIRKLEEEFELVLFNRQEKDISLTAEGETLLKHAEKILEGCTAAETEMTELRGLSSGEVRIGIPPMMSAYYFPHIIYEFRKHYPHLKLSVTAEGAEDIQRMIAKGEIDMGIIARHNIADELESLFFLREEIVACTPNDHPLAKNKKIAYADFLKEPLIVFTHGYYMREVINKLIKDAAIQPNIIFETNIFSLVRPLIKERLGISTFLRMGVKTDDELTAISFDPPLYIELIIAWKKNRYLSRANRAFIDFLIENIAGNQEKNL